MAIKRKQIIIKSEDQFKKELIETWKKAEAGEEIAEAREPEISFTSLRALSRVLTPKRLQILKTVRKQRPSSIRELARMLGRDPKNVQEDVKILEEAGLLMLEKKGNAFTPVVDFDEIDVRVAI